MSKKLNCILLVDDDTEDNHYHKIVLDDMHITTQVEIARDGIEALQYLTKENQITPELIFLDINMPRMNGWEFLEAYEKLTDAQKEGKIIVMLTTSTNPGEKEKSEKFPGITSFNSKPLTEEMVNGILEKYFNDNLPNISIQ